MFPGTVSNLVRSIVLVCAAACMLSLLPGCEQSPQCPDVIINEGDDDDATLEEILIPAGAKFFSAYYESDYAPVVIDADAGTNTRIVITRIDYFFYTMYIDTHKFEFLDSMDEVIGEYQIPIKYHGVGWSVGTQFLHMPIDQGGAGGGLGFPFGNAATKVWKFRVTGDLLYSPPDSMIRATIFGYTYTP